MIRPADKGSEVVVQARIVRASRAEVHDSFLIPLSTNVC